jgi:hypothetical protein
VISTRRFTELFGMHAAAHAAGNDDTTDPIGAALAAHGEMFKKKKKPQVTGASFFDPNTKWK